MNTLWIEKRKNFKILKNHSNKSSKLKQKQSIINKLKNLPVENFNDFLIELDNENFNKFHTEIVNNLLSNQLVSIPSKVPFQLTFEYIYKIVEIIYLFSFDQAFLNFLVLTLKKSLDNWAYCCIYLELFVFTTKTKNTIEAAALCLIDASNNNRLYFILYCLEGFNMKEDFINNIKNNIIKNELKNVNENNYEVLKRITSILKMDDDLKLPNNYIEVIKLVPGEFNFYEDSEPPVNFEFPSFTPQLIKHIEKKKYEPYMLDYIGQNILNHPELINKIIAKKKYIEFIPSLARILSKSIKNSKSYCCSIYGSQEGVKNIILIAECYKFGLFTNNDIFDLINQFIESNSISDLCTLLENVGRFILYKKETNIKAIEVIDKIKHLSVDFSNKACISQCISQLLNPTFCKATILDFLRWFLNSTEYENTEIFKEMLESKRFLLILMLQAALFENRSSFLKFLNLISEKITVDFLLNFYLNLLPKVKVKMMVNEYIQYISHIISSVDENKVIEVLDSILESEIEDFIKYRIILILLEDCNKEIQQVYFNKIEKKNKNDDEYKAMLFNFCEKYGYFYISRCVSDYDEDSFDLEFELMSKIG